MKCKFCGNNMRLNDVDFNFKGYKDNYWSCDNCKACAFEKKRYGKSTFVEFAKEGEYNGYFIYW